MKSFLFKLILFVVLLLTAQVVVSAMDPPELPEEVLELDEQLREGIDILYLGDSTLIHPVGEPTIPEILPDLLTDHTLGDVAHPAYNLDLYERYVNYLVTNKYQVEAVIIPINMRSFSPEWDLRPSYQFEREKTVLTYGPTLSTIFYRPLDTFGLFDPPISEEEFQEATVFNGDQPVGEVAEFEELIGFEAEESALEKDDFAYYVGLPSEGADEVLKATLVYYYMYGLDRNHRKIQSLRTTSQLLTENGIKPIFYITPINYQLGERYIGETFRQRVAENTAVVEQVLRRRDVDVLNLVFDLEAYNFVDTEHLTENGKTYVAESLAAAIESSLSDQPPALTAEDTVTAPAASPEAVGRVESTPTPVPTATGLEIRVSTSTATPLPSVSVVTVAAEATSTPTATTPASTPTATSTAQPTATATALPPTPAATSSIQITATPTAPPPTPTATPTATATPTTTSTPTPRSIAAQQAGQLVSVEYWTSFEPVGNYVLDFYRVRYTTLDWSQRVVEVEAILYVPQVNEPTEFPVFVYAPGTTGLSDRCAPLNERTSGDNWGLYHNYMYEYSAQGLIGVLPNYQGFGDDNQPHPYFISEFQARALLDAARAAFNFFDQTPGVTARPMDAVIMAGYSSGGHAVFAAKDVAPDYAPELPFKGIIGHGPTTNIETLLRESAVFSPYIVQTYRDFYGADVVEPAEIFLDRWLANFQSDVMSRCVDDLFAYYSFSARRMYRPEFLEALRADRLQATLPKFKAALDANSSGLSPDGADIPVLILQGTADQIVTPPSQRSFASRLCELGNHVTYISYPAVDHPNIRRASFRDTVNWIKSAANGNLLESTCDSLNNP